MVDMIFMVLVAVVLMLQSWLNGQILEAIRLTNERIDLLVRGDEDEVDE